MGICRLTSMSRARSHWPLRGLLILSLAASGALAHATATSDATAAILGDEAPVATTGFTAEQVFQILAGEVAARRGDMATAFGHYLEAAELTGDARVAELAVRAALDSDDLAATEEGVRRWLALDPRSSAAHQIGAFARIKAADQEGALLHLMRLVELSREDHETAFTQAATIISRAAAPEARLALMQTLVEQFADDPHAQQALAMVAANASASAVAETAARRAIALRPDWSKPRLFLVKMLLAEDHREEARAVLEDYLALSPDDQASRMLYGQFLVEERDYSTARDVFERVLQNRPKEPDVLFAVGVLSLQLDEVEEARRYLTRLYETGERREEAAFYLGQVEERAENPEAALDWYAKVDGVNATDARIRIAVIHARAGDLERAREMLHRLRGEGPENAIVLYMVEAEILDSVGRLDEALNVFDTALNVFPDDEDLLYARALMAVKGDRIDEAERDLRRIIERDPEHADALNALGYTLADRTDRFAEAKVYIEKAYALKPEEPAILDSMGWIHHRLGDHETALTYLRQALDLMSDGEIAAHLGEVLWAMDRREEAWAVWNAALEEHADHQYLNEVIGRHRAASSGSVE